MRFINSIVMTNEKRRCLAFLYASILRPTKNYRNVYDYQQGQYHFYRVTRRDEKSIMVFDYSRSAYMGGNLPNIFDYHSASYISFQEMKPEIKCFDYERSNYVRGQMTASIVSLFDYETGTYSRYLIS